MPTIEIQSENLWAESVTIAAGANAADAVWTQGHALVGVFMPAAWTAANLGFEVSYDNVTYRTAVSAGNAFEQSNLPLASQYVAFPSADALFGPYIKVKSVDASNVAVNQVAAATLILLFRRFLGGQ